ncbi:MAG: sigma-54 dependent transcriptional regulator [Candidatus Cloacimonetes bacterium]|nr:sigma-54 dependent transcriptional regulator [Candidatus Cloacimonadota bacterium]MDD4099605.1 sigma-54 dependent transcriptional regulator [Candidatus Cloacimonadota bacterium]
MSTNAYTALLHQMILMARDPLIYIAIDEESGSFAPEERTAIRVAKAHALLGTLKLEEALALAMENYRELALLDLPELAAFNIFALIGIFQRLGDHQAVKNYSDETMQLIGKNSPADVSLLVKCVQMTQTYLNFGTVQDALELISEKLDKAEHPYCRTSVLRCLGQICNLSGEQETALSYLSAAYDVASQNQISIYSLQICIEMVSICSQLGKFEIAERFYNISTGLIDQLRIPAYKVDLNYNYGIMKNLQKDHHASVLFFKQSLEALAENKVILPLTQFDIYNKLSNALNDLGESKQALEYQLEAEKLISETGTDEMKMEISSSIALSMIALKQWDEAISRLNAASDFYREHNRPLQLIRVTRLIAHYHEQRGDFVHAYAAMTKVDELNTSFINTLRNSNSHASEQKLKEIMADSKALREKYDNLLLEITRRQAARFIGETKAAKRVIDSAVLAAMHQEASVLIQGESGTGKEVLAQMIHYGSAQKNAPFITVNCAAISPSLFDIDFFGSAAGPLTGIEEERIGYFEQAGTGTLFLDEISEIPLEFQLKLLSVLDTRSFIPVGKANPIPIKCRIVSSTNQDPLEMFKSGKFRMDLLHRLNTLEINIPPLRERIEDVKPLVEKFARDFSRETTKRLPQIKDSFYDRLGSYKFPGNVRELKNIIERIYILYYAPVWTGEILDNIDAFRRNKHLSGSLIDHNIKELDRERIIEALRKTGGKQKTAAKLLNMTESTLCRKIKRYGIK